jgi:hypothetical protein
MGMGEKVHKEWKFDETLNPKTLNKLLLWAFQPFLVFMHDTEQHNECNNYE